MKNILIIQNLVPHYRKPLYNKLSEFFNITVLHSGEPSVSNSDYYEELIYPKNQISKFYFQHGVYKQIRSDKYDAVIVMFDLAWFMNIIGLFLKGKTRYLLWGHRYNNKQMINRIKSLIMRFSDGIILYGENDIPMMIKSKIDKKKIFVAHNTMHIDNAEDGSTFKNKTSLLFVGRAQKRKSVDLLLKSFSRILDKIPHNITIDIIGEGEENEILSKLAIQLGISERVLFHGTITDEKLLKPYFFKSIVYVSPGAVGLSVLQCFAYGLPIVTCRHRYHGPEFDNIINYENSIVYDNEWDLDDILTYHCNNINESRGLGHNAFQYYSDKRNMDVMVSGFINAVNGSVK